jgi:NAD(P)-dependent dehydrogenase (short-subunit alcohol dehydrogenase family)
MGGRLDGRTAIVTAAAGGIGGATVRRLAEDGARTIIAIDIAPAALSVVCSDAAHRGAEAHPVVLDCTDADAVRETLAEILVSRGPIDILVNLVGRSAQEKASEFWESEPETWRGVLDMCLTSAMLCSRQVVPQMRERQTGKIVNISSDIARRPDRGWVDYAAAKSGIIGFTRALAMELAPAGVNVNAVAPGTIATNAIAKMPPAMMDRMRASIPFGDVGAPEDVANCIAFLVSDDSRYITGQTIGINGGRTTT